MWLLNNTFEKNNTHNKGDNANCCSLTLATSKNFLKQIKNYHQSSLLQIKWNNTLQHDHVTRDWMEEPEQSKIQNGARHTESKITIRLTWKERGNNEFKISNRDCPSLCAHFASATQPSHFSWISYGKEESRCVSTSPCLNGKGSMQESTQRCAGLAVRRLTPLLLQARNKALTETSSWSLLGVGTGCLGQSPPDLLQTFFRANPGYGPCKRSPLLLTTLSGIRIFQHAIWSKLSNGNVVLKT